MNINKYIKEIYLLRNLKRYNNSFHIKDESVMEHTGFVAAIILGLHLKYKFILENALVMALVHDFPEAWDITDIAHNVKQAHPKIAKEIKIAEYQEFSKRLPQYYKYFDNFEEGNSVEALIVLLADVLSCVQYSDSEITLGNMGYMKKVFNESKVRQKQLEKKLKRYLR